MQIDMELIRQIVNLIIVVAAVVFGVYYVKFKRKLGAATALMVALNDALTDDQVSEAEWMGLFTRLDTLLHDCPASEPPREKKTRLYLIIAIVCGVVFLVWYFFVHGW